MAFFINQSQQVTGFHSQEVQDVLIVAIFNIIPHNALFQVLLLLQLENVVHKELLQLLVGKINAQLLEAVQPRGWDEGHVFSFKILRVYSEGRVKKCPDLFMLKFSKPKISSRPMDRKEDVGLLVNFL